MTRKLILGEKPHGKLIYKGVVIATGPFPVLQKTKKNMIANGCDRTKFKLTYL